LSQKRQFFRKFFRRNYFKNHNIGSWTKTRVADFVPKNPLMYVFGARVFFISNKSDK
jgi:hypothetical protein